jgi:hypothetical protein
MSRIVLLSLCLLLPGMMGCGSGKRASRIPSPPPGGAVSVAPPRSAVRPPFVGTTKSAKSTRASKAPEIRLNQQTLSFEVLNLRRADLDKLARASLTQEQWQGLFSVYVNLESPALQGDRPAVLGSYQVDSKALRFVPKYPLAAGLGYRAVFNPAKLPDHAASEKAIVSALALAKEASAADTVVQQVYPTADRLPENQLKFYLHFSAPMSRGESYRHIHLLDSAGKAIDLPFLELDEELWDPEGKRFTLFFDPGRIKRGLKPREEVGPALEEGKSYTLVIDSQWQDAQGSPLKESFRKAFSVSAPDDRQPDVNTWKIQPAPAGSSKPLLILFPKPMDHALLQRTIVLLDASGQKVAGTIAVGKEEKSWQFNPQKPWQASKYMLSVDRTLEDLAGNSLAHPFEVDEFHPIQKQVSAELVNLPLEIR